jgi:hypothetical protein
VETRHSERKDRAFRGHKTQPSEQGKNILPERKKRKRCNPQTEDHTSTREGLRKGARSGRTYEPRSAGAACERVASVLRPAATAAAAVSGPWRGTEGAARAVISVGGGEHGRERRERERGVWKLGKQRKIQCTKKLSILQITPWSSCGTALPVFGWEEKKIPFNH